MRKLLFLLFSVLTGCSWLGSYSALHTHSTYPIQNVAVIITQDVLYSNAESEYENLLLSKTLAEEFSRKKLFRFKILKRLYPKNSVALMESLHTELHSHYDGYLVCTPERKKNGNYKVELKLYQTRQSALLITARHSTSMGNSYWFYQPYNAMLVDATRSAVSAFETKWKKISPR